MKTARFVALLGLIGATGVQAQLRSVTRPTIQLPLGMPTLLQPQAGNLSPAIGTAPAAPSITYVRPYPPLRDRTDPAERERARREFEIQCAERGLPSFQFSLAGRYLKGDGVPYDPEKALELLRSAAAKGHDKAKRVVERFEQLVAHREKAREAPSPEDAADPASEPSLPLSPAWPSATEGSENGPEPLEEPDGGARELGDPTGRSASEDAPPPAVAGEPAPDPLPVPPASPVGTER